MFVQKLLKSLKDGLLTLDELSNFYGIKIREYSANVNPEKNLYVLNYDQIKAYSSRFSDVVRVCRQLIIDQTFSHVYHRSFDRFYNYGEDPHTAEFDISKAVCDEKLDGSLVGCYVYEHDYLGVEDLFEWFFCTKSMAFAEGPIPPNVKGYKTFSDVIRSEIIDKNNLENTVYNFNPNYSYIFELVSPFDRHVTRYTDSRLVLLAVRERQTGRYIDREREADRLNWPWLPKTYKFKSIGEIMEAAKSLPNLEEGYVCRIGDWRIKIKNPAHVACSSLRGNGALNHNKILELVLMREEEEYLSYYPEDRKYFQKYIDTREDLPRFFEDEYQKVKNIENQKDFALAIKDIPNNSILFKMRSTGKSAAEIIDNLKLSQQEKLYERVHSIN